LVGIVVGLNHFAEPLLSDISDTVISGIIDRWMGQIWFAETSVSHISEVISQNGEERDYSTMEKLNLRKQ
jgi:hypothetical protein